MTSDSALPDLESNDSPNAENSPQNSGVKSSHDLPEPGKYINFLGMKNSHKLELDGEGAKESLGSDNLLQSSQPVPLNQDSQEANDLGSQNLVHSTIAAPSNLEPQELVLDLDIPGDSGSQKLKTSPQVRLRSEGGQLLLVLPTESQLPASDWSWSLMWEQMKVRLNGGDRFWQPQTAVHLQAQDRLLDGRQLQVVADALGEFQLQLKSVATSRRQTAVAAAGAGYSVEQIPPVTIFNSPPPPAPTPLGEPLYIQMTLRSGVEIRHPGTVVVMGDVNAGAAVIADGDILIWGRLRGLAHAGAAGNRNCLIMALQMKPTQLRIADAVARAPETAPVEYYPEVAYVTPKGIRITKAADFTKSPVEITYFQDEGNS